MRRCYRKRLLQEDHITRLVFIFESSGLEHSSSAGQKRKLSLRCGTDDSGALSNSSQDALSRLARVLVHAIWPKYGKQRYLRIQLIY